MTARILRLADVRACTGLGRSSIYRLMSEGRFPPPVKLTDRAVGWREEEITTWIQSREPAQPEERRGASA